MSHSALCTDRHSSKVRAISARVRYFYDRNEGYRIYHGSTNSTRAAAFERSRVVDTSSLSDVLAIDHQRKLAVVEPNVPMDSLVRASLSHGLLPPVVPEFPGITVGGAFAGTAGESSSFKYGFFDRTADFIEIVLADGQVRVAALKQQNGELFEAAAGSFGTMGVITAVGVRLRKAQTHVEVTYHSLYTVSDALDRITQLTQANRATAVDFVDGIVYARDKIVVIAGRLENRPTGVKTRVKVQTFTRPTDPWFYLHAEKQFRTAGRQYSDPRPEYVPLMDYLFRYDRGSFWMAKYGFRYFCMPLNRVTRFLLDQNVRTRCMYRGLHASGMASQYVIQDVAVPMNSLALLLDFVHEQYGFFPLWLCPLRFKDKQAFMPRALLKSAEPTGSIDTDNGIMMMNVGIWGPGPKDWPAFVASNRALEQKVQALGGSKWLYANTYYTEDEFWEVYDKERYDAVRAKYNVNGLPNVYEKVKNDLVGKHSGPRRPRICPQSRIWGKRPFCGVYGAYRMLRGGDYLIKKQ